MNDSHSEEQIATTMRRLEKLEAQQAYQGIQTPPEILMEIEDIRNQIADLQYQRTQLIFQTNHLDFEPPPYAQALIVLVSPLQSGKALSTLGTYQAIDYHRGPLRHCWLIATEAAQPTAEALAKYFGFYRIDSTIRMIVNGGDALDTQVLIGDIYAQIEKEGRFSSDAVIIDITGGTKAMTVGTALACSNSRKMQYLHYQQGLPSLPVLLHVVNDEEPAS